MKVGTKSLLFGVHQVAWHPLLVLIAWWKLYGCPSWRELVCIIIHDWGYWGKPNMDGLEGEDHPRKGALLAERLFGVQYGELCLYHSRHYTRLANARLRGLDEEAIQPSRLCWADKLSITFEPAWFYLARARLSGELFEFRQRAADTGTVAPEASHWEWFEVIRAHYRRLAATRDARSIPYIMRKESNSQAGGARG